jgi:hypothetical protein
MELSGSEVDSVESLPKMPDSQSSLMQTELLKPKAQKSKFLSAISTPERSRLRNVDVAISETKSELETTVMTSVTNSDLKTFNGSWKSIHPQTFIKHLLWLRNTYGLSEEELVNLLPKCLAGVALDWYYSLESFPDSLSDFAEQFLDRFYPDSLQNARHLRLTLLQQSKRPVAKYEREFVSISKSLNLPPEETSRQFFAGLNRSNQKGLLPALISNPNIDELTELAKAYENLNFRPKSKKFRSHKKYKYDKSRKLDKTSNSQAAKK